MCQINGLESNIMSHIQYNSFIQLSTFVMLWIQTATCALVATPPPSPQLWVAENYNR